MTIYDYIGYIPSLSANNKDKSAASQQLAADLILYTYKLKGNPCPKWGQYHGKSKGGKIILRIIIEPNVAKLWTV